MELEELIARESIRDLVARYNSYGDAGRIDEQIALFEREAELEVVGQRLCRGRGEIEALFRGAMGGVREAGGGAEPAPASRIRHHTATHQIDIESPERARGRCYFTVYTDRGVDHWGRYLDRYRRRDGSWRFVARRVEIEGQVPGGWADRTTARLAREG